MLASCHFLHTVFSSISNYGVQLSCINFANFQTYTLQITGETLSLYNAYIVTNCKLIYFWIVCAGLKLRIKVTLHKADVRENSSWDGCYSAAGSLIIQTQGIPCIKTVHMGINMYIHYLLVASVRNVFNLKQKKSVSLPRELSRVLTAAVSVFQLLKICKLCHFHS